MLCLHQNMDTSRMVEMVEVVVMAILFSLSGLGHCAVNLSTFRSLYIRMPELQLSASPTRRVVNATPEICARTCVEEVNFDCRSFDLDHLHRTCRLFNTSYEDGRAYLRESSSVDHYRSAFEKLFNRLPNHVITVAHKRKVPGLSVERCARRCIFEMNFQCKGFDYEPQHRNCWLTDLSVENSGAGVKYHHGADYYERISDGPVSNFINYGMGSLPMPEGYQIYSKIMFGLTLGACAQLCLTQANFRCSSFDFSFSDKSCHMSRYTAAELNGLNHDVMPTYRIMHYERKGEYLEYYYPTPYTIILGRNDKTLQSVSAETCAKRCLQDTEVICRSFDYQIRNGTCLLSSKTGSDVGRLYYQGQAQAHHFELKPFLECGGVLTAQHGVFASPNWPRKYEHNLNCTWIIRVPKHKVITLTFSHFDLGPRNNNPCDLSNDRLIISEVTSHGPVRFCATSPMTSYISHSLDVTLQFVSTHSQDAPGFSVFYKGDWPCNAVLTKSEGQIASPAWPLQYPADQHCQWTIQAPPEAHVTLRFSAVDLDGQGFGSCTDHYDFIKVYDGDSTTSTLLGMLCGHDPVTSYRSTGHVLLVEFQTDSHVQRTGFHATYRFVFPYTTTTTTITTLGPTDTTRIAHGFTSDGFNKHHTKSEVEGSTRSFYDVIDKVTSLTAEFVEPVHDVRVNWSAKSTPPVNTTARQPLSHGEDGGEFSGPKVPVSGNDTGDKFIRTMWTVLVSLLLMLFTLLLVLLLVCIHYRKRAAKRRQVPNYTFTEEDLTLYEKDTSASTSTHNIDSTSYSFQNDPDPEIAFSNPLYESRYPPPSQSHSRRTSLTTMTSFSRC